ncbi:hypothetical protein GW17_00012158 [Ensete ventricosum]|nr:hypothetical protein GW17_00012158 [Ensete ventricosum]
MGGTYRSANHPLSGGTHCAYRPIWVPYRYRQYVGTPVQTNEEKPRRRHKRIWPWAKNGMKKLSCRLAVNYWIGIVEGGRLRVRIR